MPRGTILVAVVAAAVLAAPPAQGATVNCASQNLQAKINAASAGATLRIKGTCLGTFTVSKAITLKGSPSATLDGRAQGTTLTITGSPTVHLVRLTITGGLAPPDGGGFARGGGINHAGGKLTLASVTVADNAAAGSDAFGGGIYSDAGPLIVTSSSIVRNRAEGSDSNGGIVIADGGGIYSGGRLTIVGSRVGANEATALSTAPAAFGNSADAGGGGIDAAAAAPLVIKSSHIDGNRAYTAAESQAQTIAGGLYVPSDDATVSITGSTISGNLGKATSSASVAEVFGGAVSVSIGTATFKLSHSTVSGNRASARGATFGASVNGGALDLTAGKSVLGHARVLDNRSVASATAAVAAVQGAAVNVGGPLSIADSLLARNVGSVSASGPARALGGIASTGGSNISVSRTTIDRNRLEAGSSGADANVVGGAIYTVGHLAMTRSTVSRNEVIALAEGAQPATVWGAGITFAGGFLSAAIGNSTITGNVARADAPSGSPSALGGGIYANVAKLTLTNTTVARNSVSSAGNASHGGGIYREGASVVTLRGTILALNTAPSASNGANCFDALTSGGYNLLGTTAGCTFAKKSTDKVGKNPKLGALASNGGPTQTLALLRRSPAIDAIPKHACLVGIDQRGVKRPQHLRCDIGSYERKS